MPTDAFDPADYCGRNVIEHRFNLIRQWRGLATRYDRLATVYRAAIAVTPGPKHR